MHVSCRSSHSVTNCHRCWMSHLRDTSQHAHCPLQHKQGHLQTRHFCHQFHVHVKHDRLLVHSFMRQDARELICHSSCHDSVAPWTSGTIGLRQSPTHTVACNLTLIICGNDVWEDVKNFTCSDSSFASPRSGARLIVLAWQNGSTFPVEWKSKRQAATATSSGDAEAIECSSAVKAVVRSAEMFEFSRKRHPETTYWNSPHRLTPAGCRTWKQHETWAPEENGGGKLQFLDGDTDTVGTSGHQRERCRHFHENVLLHKAPVSPLTMVRVGIEPQQQFTSCAQCRIPQTPCNVRKLQLCGYWPPPVCCVFVQNVSSLRICYRA